MKAKGLLFIVLILGFATCATAAKRKDGNGNMVTKEISVKEFTSIVIDDKISYEGKTFRNLFGRNTNTPSFHYEQTTGNALLKVTIDENLFEYLSVEQSGTRIKITTKDKNKINPSQLVFHGSSSNLHGVEINGVLNFYSKQTVKTDELNLKITGVGNINFEALDCGNLDCLMTGVGGINLAGKANEATYKMTGVGDIKAYDLNAKILHANLTGVGSMQVYASEKLNANLSGVGDIRYKGSATVNGSASGMGKIKKAD